MSKSKINLKETLNEINEVFEFINQIEQNDINKLDIKGLAKKASFLKEKIEKKYKNNLDTEK